MLDLKHTYLCSNTPLPTVINRASCIPAAQRLSKNLAQKYRSAAVLALKGRGDTCRCNNGDFCISSGLVYHRVYRKGLEASHIMPRGTAPLFCSCHLQMRLDPRKMQIHSHDPHYSQLCVQRNALKSQKAMILFPSCRIYGAQLSGKSQLHPAVA